MVLRRKELVINEFCYFGSFQVYGPSRVASDFWRDFFSGVRSPASQGLPSTALCDACGVSTASGLVQESQTRQELALDLLKYGSLKHHRWRFSQITSFSDLSVWVSRLLDSHGQMHADGYCRLDGEELVLLLWRRPLVSFSVLLWVKPETVSGIFIQVQKSFIFSQAAMWWVMEDLLRMVEALL